MTAQEPSMILSAAIMRGMGMHLGAWRVRDGDASDYLSGSLYKEIARTAEAGKLHALFLAEGLTMAEAGTSGPVGSLDTATVLSHMGAVTDHIGLVGTASTTYNEPYDIARRFATLDHLTHGRAGWNSVATQNVATAAMFGGGEHPDHADRYARADEFIDVVLKLWDSWEEGALVGDKASGLFAHAEMVHEINHVGERFSVKGPLPFPRTPQGHPVIFQAGSSDRGRAQAARFADAVFTSQHQIDGAIEFRNDMRERAQANGRHPDSLKVFPGMSLILGGTEAEARERKRVLEETLGLGPNLAKMARRTGVPLEALELDKPFPVHLLGRDEDFKGSIGFRRSIVSLAVAENLTVRELVQRYGGGHQEVIGSAEQVADIMQKWIGAGAADGFTIMVDMLPSGLHDIADLLVPELQSRGMFHREYEHDTLRGNLGLTAPELAVAQ